MVGVEVEERRRGEYGTGVVGDETSRPFCPLGDVAPSVDCGGGVPLDTDEAVEDVELVEATGRTTPSCNTLEDDERDRRR